MILPAVFRTLYKAGRLFFVHTFGGAGTIGFTENAKLQSSRLVTRQVNPGNGNNRQLRTNLYAVSSGNPVLLDAVMNEYNSSYSNTLDIMDALKMPNVNESLGLLSGKQNSFCRKKKRYFFSRYYFL